MARTRYLLAIASAGAAVIGLGLVSLALGSAGIPPRQVFALLWSWLRGHPEQGAIGLIILQLRLPRIILGGLVGAGLATAGTAFQAILRNPLADPYVIGVSAGAGLGATLGIILGMNTYILGFSTVPALAFLGAVITVALVYGLARMGSGVSISSLLLAGVAVGAFLTACISLLLVFYRRNLDEVVFWLMGGLAGRGWRQVWNMVPYVLLGLAVLRLLARNLNLMTLGEEHAAYLGVEVARTKNLTLAAGSLLAAAAVAMSGVIGFVGLMIPHMARMIIGGDHRRLIPFTALFGAAFMMAADTIARVALAPLEIPVGVITALCGGPFFLWLLRRRGRAA
ncbi:MAG: FecCD family ABC transporter permease [Bacteroidota bacterium]